MGILEIVRHAFILSQDSRDKAARREVCATRSNMEQPMWNSGHSLLVAHARGAGPPH